MSTPTPGIRPKLRSCMVCRNRKVRCDKQTPCSNCRRADIPCIPPADRRPRWATRLDGGQTSTTAPSTGSSSTPGPIPGGTTPADIDQVLDRVQNLEGMVKQLSAQLEQERAAPAVGNIAVPVARPSEDQQSVPAAGPNPGSGVPEQQFGRLVLKDSADRSLYVTSAFWSQISDELEKLKMDVHALAGADSESSDDEVESGRLEVTDELAGSPLERHAFLFRLNLGPNAPDLGKLKPLPSQIPFLLDVFHENINSLGRLVHMPTITKMVRASRNAKMPTAAYEALMFSIYYAAVVSMEDEDVTLNFGASKAELSMRYRLGLEYALAQADFLNAPDIVCLQALIGFLWLLRRQGSPTLVWMLTGLAVRLAQYLGVQRDGTQFPHLTPFEVEMRRRIWWNLYALDLRAAEDQGTDPAIPTGSYDTELPSNVNDADLDPDSATVPAARAGFSDLSFARMVIKTGVVMRQMMGITVGGDAASLETLEGLLHQIRHIYEHEYGQYTREKGDIVHWVGATITRLSVAKMTLLVFLPVLLVPDGRLSAAVRDRLLGAALEVAECNDALNAEPAGRRWRWIFQTYTHWYAVVYLLLETSRRPWAPVCERAWHALHSGWLIPRRTLSATHRRVWIPLRQLMARVHAHRTAEYRRLGADRQAVAALDQEEQDIPEPASSTARFRERWYELINTPPTPDEHAPASTPSDPAPARDAPGLFHAAPIADPAPAVGGSTDWPDDTSLPAHAGGHEDPSAQLNSLPWLWAGSDAALDPFQDLGLDLDEVGLAAAESVDWYGWVESARDMERGHGPN